MKKISIIALCSLLVAQTTMHHASENPDENIITVNFGSMTQSDLVTKNQEQAERIRNISDGLTMNIFDIIESVKKIHQIKPSEIQSEESHKLSNDMTENNIILKDGSHLKTIFHENGHPIETIYSIKTSNGELKRAQKTSYSLKKMHHAHIYSFVYENLYDVNDNLIVETSFNGHGPIEFHTVLHSPTSGYKTHSFEMKDNVITASKYDEEGKLIRAHDYNHHKKLIRKKAHNGITTTVTEIDPIKQTSSIIITDPFNRNITEQYQQMSTSAGCNDEKIAELNAMIMNKQLLDETSLTEKEKLELKMKISETCDTRSKQNWFTQQKASWNSYRGKIKNNSDQQTKVENLQAHDSNKKPAIIAISSSITPIHNPMEYIKTIHGITSADIQSELSTQLPDNMTEQMIVLINGSVIKTILNIHKCPIETNLWVKNSDNVLQKNKTTRYSKNFFDSSPTKPTIEQSYYDAHNNVRLTIIYHGNDPKELMGVVKQPIVWQAITLQNQAADKKSKTKIVNEETKHSATLQDGSILETNLNHFGQPVDNTLLVKDNHGNLKKAKTTSYSRSFFDQTDPKSSIHQMHYSPTGELKLDITYFGNDLKEFNRIVHHRPITWNI